MWVDGPSRTADQVDPTLRQRLHDMQYHAFTIPEPAGVQVLNLDPPALTRLEELRIPTLLMAGEFDLLSKIADTEQLATRIPQAHYQFLPGAGHILNMEQPDAFNQHVLTFLTQNQQNSPR